MKILLIVLFLSMVFSASVQAKKVQINHSKPGSVYLIASEDGCTYQCVDNSFVVSYHVHKGVSVGLKLLYGEEVIDVSTTDMTRTHNGAKNWCRGDFYGPSGQEWSLLWVLERGRTKTHVIDAVEMAVGTCPP